MQTNMGTQYYPTSKKRKIENPKNNDNKNNIKEGQSSSMEEGGVKFPMEALVHHLAHESGQVGMATRLRVLSKKHNEMVGHYDRHVERAVEKRMTDLVSRIRRMIMSPKTRNLDMYGTFLVRMLNKIEDDIRASPSATRSLERLFPSLSASSVGTEFNPRLLAGHLVLFSLIRFDSPYYTSRVTDIKPLSMFGFLGKVRGLKWDHVFNELENVKHNNNASNANPSWVDQWVNWWFTEQENPTFRIMDPEYYRTYAIQCLDILDRNLGALRLCVKQLTKNNKNRNNRVPVLDPKWKEATKLSTLAVALEDLYKFHPKKSIQDLVIDSRYDISLIRDSHLLNDLVGVIGARDAPTIRLDLTTTRDEARDGMASSLEAIKYTSLGYDISLSRKQQAIALGKLHAIDQQGATRCLYHINARYRAVFDGISKALGIEGIIEKARNPDALVLNHLVACVEFLNGGSINRLRPFIAQKCTDSNFIEWALKKMEPEFWNYASTRQVNTTATFNLHNP
jgi:hypothetical protein